MRKLLAHAGQKWRLRLAPLRAQGWTRKKSPRGAVYKCLVVKEINMKIKATFRTDDLIVAEYFFDVDGAPPVGTSGDLAERAKAAFDEFTRNEASFPLVSGGARCLMTF
jgi:hypothetical protein